MGLILIIFSSLSGIINLVTIFLIINITAKVQQIYQETDTVMPFWTKNAWIIILIFLVINLFTILFGRFLLKHPELNKKYLWLSILLLILVLFGIPFGLKYIFFPIMWSIYNMALIGT